MLCLGIEGTAHTFAAGVVDENFKILADARSAYKPEKGGIHPAEAALHHKNSKEKTLEEALAQANATLSDIDFIAYSAGPGLPPCLRVVTEYAKALAQRFQKPLVAVNHPVAHLEIAKILTQSKDPIFVYVSGGNTQIIGYASRRYRVFGETLDIAIGNAIDEFIRKLGFGFPGGPILEEKASKGKNYIELPYVVKGMDLSFSGIVTAALKKWEKISKNKAESEHSAMLNDICFSFQETIYAMLTEVTERAMAHTGKTEALLTGGVAASKRLREMMDVMCRERGGRFFACPKEYSGDNGVMIAATGLIQYKHGDKTAPADADFYPRWRVDDVEIKWMQ